MFCQSTMANWAKDTLGVGGKSYPEAHHTLPYTGIILSQIVQCKLCQVALRDSNRYVRAGYNNCYFGNLISWCPLIQVDTV